MRFNFILILSILLESTNALFAQNILRWSDEFDGNSIDTTKWEYQIGDGCPDLCGWGNNELEWYKKEAVNVKNGLLTIKALKESIGSSTYSSGRIRTINKFDFTCGSIKVSAKFPKGKAYWPAVWFLPSDKYWGTWPLSGEIDLLEGKGQEPQTVYGTIHYGAYAPNNKYATSTYTLSQGNFTDSFHEFELEWTKDTIKWFVDGNLYASKDRSMVKEFSWPFDRNFHCLINLAVGGNFLGYPDQSTPDSAEFVVDYVRVYQNIENTIISGPASIIKNASTLNFYTQQFQGATYEWVIPENASIVDGVGTNNIHLNWADKSDSIHVKIQFNGTSYLLSKFVTVLPDSCFEIIDDSENKRNFYWVGSTGTYRGSVTNPSKDSTNSSLFCNRYYRNGVVTYDVMYIQSKAINNSIPFENGSLQLKMKIYTTAPIGTVVSINIENRERAKKDYPSGRRTILQSITKKTRAWEELSFVFNTLPDPGTAANEIDQIVVLFAPNSNSSDVFYIDDIALTTKPCNGSNPVVEYEQSNLLVEPFPNPFSEHLYFSNEDLIQSISLFGMDGKTFFEHSKIEDIQAQLNNIPKGIYLLKILTKTNTLFHKIIKNDE